MTKRFSHILKDNFGLSDEFINEIYKQENEKDENIGEILLKN